MEQQERILDFSFIEELLTILYNQEFVANGTYDKKLTEILRNPLISEPETDCIKFLRLCIENRTEECFQVASIVNDKESSNLNNNTFTIYSVFYIRLLLRLVVEEKIRLTEPSLKDYSKIPKYLEDRIEADYELRKHYLWIPRMLEGQLLYFYLVHDKKCQRIDC